MSRGSDGGGLGRFYRLYCDHFDGRCDHCGLRVGLRLFCLLCLGLDRLNRMRGRYNNGCGSRDNWRNSHRRDLNARLCILSSDDDDGCGDRDRDGDGGSCSRSRIGLDDRFLGLRSRSGRDGLCVSAVYFVEGRQNTINDILRRIQYAVICFPC